MATRVKRIALSASLLLACACAQQPPASAPGDVAYVTSQGGGVTVLDTRTLAPVAQIAVGPGPRGVAITPDGRWLLTANQKTADVSVVDTAARKEVRRIPVGKNVEFMRVSPDGKLALVTYEPSSTGKPGEETKESKESEIPAEVAVIDLGKWAVVGRMKAAPETEGIEFSPDNEFAVVANEGDNTIAVYDLATQRKVRTIDVSRYGSRPRGVKLSPDGQRYVVTLENSNNFLLLDTDFKVLKSVPTARGPYGVAFDREGRRIWIAAARSRRLEAFDAHSLAQLASIPVGKRCWHFSFTPDARNLLLACGRSNALEVVDPTHYEVTETLRGYELPWGVVTYPKSPGSLDAPR
ncbi:MAG TPA: beta-propeller fold lactonase family protein [Burkholderiales bacterium]|nr:beta-propeller fold lactonase family protein [Burkholderiales bacterium]